MEKLITHWQTFDFTIAVVVFVAYILIDGMYALYTQSIAKKKPVTAASVGAIMHFFIAFGVLNYVQNFLYIIPLAIGSWIGTYYVVKRDTDTS
jgi:uncharacterized membrane protein